MTPTDTRLLQIASLAGEYCSLLTDPSHEDKESFIDRLLPILPRLYYEFLTTPSPFGEDDEENFFMLPEHADEEIYSNVRMPIAALLGEDDIYLETQLDDMKYSDTPISASISEGLADIFQDLFNFTEEVRLSEGLQIQEAFARCLSNFRQYWSFTLCNVLRALNSLKFN